jgi:hypothetical protein
MQCSLCLQENRNQTILASLLLMQGKGAPLLLHPIPKNADLHTPEKIALLCKTYVGILAA